MADNNEFDPSLALSDNAKQESSTSSSAATESSDTGRSTSLEIPKPTQSEPSEPGRPRLPTWASPWISKWVPRGSRREKVVYGSTFLLAGLTVAGVVANAFRPQTHPDRPGIHVCENKNICGLLAHAYRKHPSPVMSICDDFFVAVCTSETDGQITVKFPKHATDLENARKTALELARRWGGGNITLIDSRLRKEEESLFKERVKNYADPDVRSPNITGWITDSEMQMGKFWHSCLYRGYPDTAGDTRRFWKIFMNDIGIPFERGSDKQYLSMFSALVRLNLVWGIENPLFTIKLRPFRASEHYVTTIRTLHKGFDFKSVRLSIVRQRRAADVALNHSDAADPNMTDLRSVFVRLLNDSVDWAYKEHNLENLQNRTRNVSYIFDSWNPWAHEMSANYLGVYRFLEWRQNQLERGPPSEPFLTSFSHLEGQDGGFPWRQAISSGVRQHLNLSMDSMVYLERDRVNLQMAKLLMDPRFHRPFRHFIYVWLALMIPDGLKFDYIKEDYCFRLTKDQLPLSYMTWIGKTLGIANRSRHEVKIVLDMLVYNSARLIRNTKFMSDVDKLRAHRLLTTMVIHLGFPEYLNETRAIEHKFEIGRNLMQNLMMIKKARQEELLVDFEKRFFVTNKRWPQVPLTGPSCHYDEDLNILTVPANFMVFPHHVPGAPLWVTVAGMGWHVLQKVFHIYDSVHLTSLFADYRRIGHWESTTTREYKENQKCFQDVYQYISGFYPPDTNYTEEAIIDNAALSVTAQTFEFLERQVGIWKLDDKEVDPTRWTFPALYYVATVKPLCYMNYVYNNQTVNNWFPRWRVNYSIRDMLKHFPEGFNCTGDRFMKRRQCEFWEKI